jgi:hypothetical protein
LFPIVGIADAMQAFGEVFEVHGGLLKAYSFGGIRDEGK